MREEEYIQRFRWISLISGSILLVLLVSAWVGETFLLDWKRCQAEYREQLAIQGSGDKPAEGPAGEIYQVSPEGLHRTDRCITCHRGLENPGMGDAPQPHTSHPGNYLFQHPVEKFGCTVCHGGQGRALEKVLAFGEEPSVHWNFPLLHNPYIQSSCGKCHLGIFTEDQLLEGTGTFRHGKEVFSREGCLGCHRARGVGGILGPDLTGQGEKTKHEYSFTNIRGEQSISNWLKEHFRDPEMVSPGSDMLKMNLAEVDLEALVTFTMGLARPEFTYSYLGVEALLEFRGRRSSLPPGKAFSMICSSCHGKSGEGKDYETYEKGAAFVGNYDFVRVASGEMIRFTLLHGRGGRQMASWLPEYSGLSIEEIDALVARLDSLPRNVLLFKELSAMNGRIREGRDIFEKDCRMCHGKDGRGAIGLPLNNPDFLGVASDRFLYRTLMHGRNTAGMPAWTHYSGQELADLISFLRSWGKGPGEDRKIPLPAGDPEKGELRFHYLCSRCHGEYGEGSTGPAIGTKDFLEIASDAYLFESISSGRSHTAMFGWSDDVEGEDKLDPGGVSDILAFMRKNSAVKRAYIYPGGNPGNAGSGERLFAEHCARCHGDRGEGPSAPALNNQEFLSAATNGYLRAVISLGRKGTKMPSWGRETGGNPRLSPEERMDLAAHIRSWQRFRIPN